MNQNKELPIEKLKKQSEEFRKELIKITDGVYAAVGYDGSNAAMIVGETGVVIVDSLRALSAAETVATEFAQISSKPVAAIIYTHSHADHTGGATAFAAEYEPDVYARSNFGYDMDQGSPINQIMMKRNIRQFGRDLSDEELVNRGVAAGRTPPGKPREGFIPPNVTFSEKRKDISVAGITLELVAAPGETEDQLYVWYPEKKVLFSGDNYYHAFPNLYAIRGTKYRDVKQWGLCTDEMSQLGAEFLVPGHTRPVFGREEIKSRLSNYSRAILFVYEETLKGMNEGYTADELAASIRLPEELEAKPYLQQFYGFVPWAVRMIFSGNLGWFDGNPTSLNPLAPVEEAEKLEILAGGVDRLKIALEKAVDDEDYQWGCQLADIIIRLKPNGLEKILKKKVTCLRGLARNQINAPAYNYYMSTAREIERELSETG